MADSLFADLDLADRQPGRLWGKVPGQQTPWDAAVSRDRGRKLTEGVGPWGWRGRPGRRGFDSV